MSHVSNQRSSQPAPAHENGVIWKLDSVPVTAKRPPAVDADQHISRPGLPRANAAPSTETPNPDTTQEQSVLEAHCAYFDPDNDGVVWPFDTYHGFHDIGFNWFLSIIAVFVIHLTFSYWTQKSWIPDPRLPLYLRNVDRCKHGSDTSTYDSEGRYIPEKFEEIFSKYGKSRKAAINGRELAGMIYGNRNILDPVGWSASSLEWGALWWVAADDEGYLTKERVRANYDGSLWYTLAREQTQKRKKAAKRA